MIELIVDDVNDESLVGNIYSGLVKNILPSQFAFVDIGLKKNAFIYLSDNKEIGLFKDGRLMLKSGQTLLVQVLKDPSGSKGAYVTSRLSFTGRRLVVTKTECSTRLPIGISKKIENEDERNRLKSIFKDNTEGTEIIIRTNALNEEPDTLLNEYTVLVEKFNHITKWRNVLPPALLHKESVGLRKSISDLNSGDINEIIVNSHESFEHATACLTGAPVTDTAVKMYEGEIPVFEIFAIESQIEKAANKRVWLKSGGFVIIEKTEACVVIDVNSGKFSGKKNHEETMLQVNLEASSVIAEQLRLRNLSGIIIIDFIDLKDPKNTKSLIDYLTEEIKKDRIPVSVIGMTELGLMQLTRKKIRKPLF